MKNLANWSVAHSVVIFATIYFAHIFQYVNTHNMAAPMVHGYGGGLA